MAETLALATLADVDLDKVSKGVLLELDALMVAVLVGSWCTLFYKNFFGGKIEKNDDE
jgi:hypothetical protein